jgi:hypothetical protein
MSTTYLTNQQAGNNFYLPRTTTNYPTQQRIQSTQPSYEAGIDQGQLMVGIFLFLVPTIFSAAAFGLNYLFVEDVMEYGYYIAGAALAARIAMSIIIKGIAAEKNRSESFWITLAMITPSLSLAFMSLLSHKPTKKIVTTNKANQAKPLSSAREVYMPQRSKAM